MSAIRPNGREVPDRKFAREILRRLPSGYRISYGVVDDPDPRTGPRAVGKHPYVFDPDGNVLRGPEGSPVVVAGTPGSQRSIQRALSLIRRAGVPVR